MESDELFSIIRLTRACLLSPKQTPQASSKAASSSKGKDFPEPPAAESDAVYKRILSLLKANDAAHGTLEHGPTRTSQESADVRGVPLASGAKAMLFRRWGEAAPSPYLLLILSASERLDLKAIRKTFGKKIKMVPLAPEVYHVTGCIPGGVPPFGSLFSGVQTAVDQSIVEQGPVINFNAGMRTRSVLNLPVEDYLRIERPQLVQVTERFASRPAAAGE